MPRPYRHQIEDTYWPTYILDVFSELRLSGLSVTYKDALAEAIRRRNNGEYAGFVQLRQDWNHYVQTIHADMRRTFGTNVGIAEAVAEACRERDHNLISS